MRCSIQPGSTNVLTFIFSPILSLLTRKKNCWTNECPTILTDNQSYQKQSNFWQAKLRALSERLSPSENLDAEIHILLAQMMPGVPTWPSHNLVQTANPHKMKEVAQHKKSCWQGLTNVIVIHILTHPEGESRNWKKHSTSPWTRVRTLNNWCHIE